MNAPTMTPSTTTAVTVKDLAVRFGTDSGVVTALEGVDLELAQGGFLSILGPSGCGKSTLLRVVADLIPPAEGHIEVLGQTPERSRCDRALGFVFQDAALLPWRSALDNVRLPLEVGNADATSARDPEELLALVGLAGREHAYPHELSGGMRQRVAIARALVTQPRILLMDEPFGALDEITRDKLNEELLSIWQATGTTVMFVTHSIPEAVFLSEKILVLKANPGRVAELVDVELPYPRELEVRDTAPFVSLAAHLRQTLEEC
jgi:NitT/TauT family transport system ATP-binding protein